MAQSAGPQPLWEIGVFGMAVSQQVYPGADQQVQRNLVLPYLVYRGEWLRVERSGIELHKMLGSQMELDLGVSASLGSNRDAVDARRGMPAIGTLVEVGPRIRWTLSPITPPGRWRADLALRSVLDASDRWRKKGLVMEPQLVFEQRTNSGLQWSGSAAMVFGDERMADTYYGVAPRYQTIHRASYSAKSGLISTRLSAYVSNAVTPELRIAGGLRIDAVAGAANRSSPLVRQNSGVTGGVWLIHTLVRSQTHARD